MSDAIEARLAELGFTLPDAPKPAANYVPHLIANGLLFIAGQVSRTADGSGIKGRLGENMSVEEGRKAAEVSCINILAQVKSALGSLDRIGQTVRLTGFVNATPEFPDHPAVINGASDLLVAVLGDKGRHTRVALGVAGLPFGFAVEIDAIFAVA